MRWLLAIALVGCRSVATPPIDSRCPGGTKLESGKGDEHEARAEWCARPDGTRHGKYIGFWEKGAKSSEGELREGKREGTWRSFYEHGEVVSEGRYVAGEPHGVWLAFSLHRTFAFATCLEHGEKRWQLTSHELTEAEALAKSCP
jgi:hypothetical protein